MYFNKKIFYICRVSLLVMFLLVTMKSSIIVMHSSFSNSDGLRSEDVIEIVEGKSCGIDGSCCCGVNVSRCGCCCNSSEQGNDSTDLVVKNSGNKFLDTVIRSINCSSGIPGSFQMGSVSDYEPSSLSSYVYLLENSGNLAFLQEGDIVAPHLSLPYKPPKNIS